MLAALKKLLAPQPPRLVIFDLDGTLVDSVRDLKSALDDMHHALGMPLADTEQVRRWVGNGAQMLVRRALSYDLEPSPLDEERYAQAYQLFLEAYRQHNGEAAELYEGALELVSRLQAASVAVAIVTNKPARFTGPLLDQLGLQVPFVLSGDSLAHKKPHPLPLLTCLDHFECSPDEAVMVGDSSSDILAAKAAGLKSVGVSYGYNHGVSISELKPDLIVDSLTELS
ncbi:MAG: phosphoglycolate phosphatase [Oleiphilus sp.]|nr:MAG: phosphoglycolate phosphatase [Oleiphilus sp.]